MEEDSLEAWSLDPTMEEQEEEEAALISASITDDQLRALTGSHQLDAVDFLQMAVDSSCVPLDTLGERLPRLEQLKLNGSSLPSIRELGTSLSHLRVLWLCRCGLAELDGMSALPELQELYLAFNDIEKIDSLAPLDQLQVLDLEANVVSDMNQVEWLQFLPAMQELTLRGNPVGESPSYRARTLALLPNLELLDDEDRSTLDAPEDAADASPLSPPRVAPWVGSDLAARGSADGAPPGAAEAVEAATRLGSPGRSETVLEAEAQAQAQAEARRRRRAEEQLVSHAIKYAEVGRVFDVSFDGRAFLGGSGATAAARPATAVTGMVPSTRSGLRPGSSGSFSVAAGAGSLARPATALALARPTTSMRPGTNAGYAGMSRRRNPLDGRLETGREDCSSDLTMSGAEVICGVGALRRNKLQREQRLLNTAPAAATSPVKSSSPRRPARSPAWDGGSGSVEEGLSAAPTADASMGADAASPSPARSGKAAAAAPPPPRQPPPGAELDSGLMDELRALKLQLLLSGEPADELSEEERLSEEGEHSPPPPAAARLDMSMPGQACGYPLADEADELPLPTSFLRAAVGAAPLGSSSSSAALLRPSSSQVSTAELLSPVELDAGPRPPGAASPGGRRSFLATSPSKARSLRLSQIKAESPKPEGASREQGYLSPVTLRSLAMAEVAHSEGADILTL